MHFCARYDLVIWFDYPKYFWDFFHHINIGYLLLNQLTCNLLSEYAFSILIHAHTVDNPFLTS